MTWKFYVRSPFALSDSIIPHFGFPKGDIRTKCPYDFIESRIVVLCGQDLKPDSLNNDSYKQNKYSIHPSEDDTRIAT